MVLTQNELVGALQHEVHILQHLCTKIDPSMRYASSWDVAVTVAVRGTPLTNAISPNDAPGPNVFVGCPPTVTSACPSLMT